MANKVTFETATLSDAVKKVGRVAPARGKAFDEAGGIVLDLMPEEGLVVVRATNNDIFYREWITATFDEGCEATSWRFPSAMVVPVVTSLPIGTGKNVVLEEVQSGTSGHVLMKAGRVKGKFNLMDMTYYPDWDVFDPEGLTPVADMGGRVAMIEWSAGTGEPPLSGVNFTGTEARATDRYRLTNVPLVIEGIDPDGGGVTVPAGLLGGLLRQTGDVLVGFTEHQMLLVPDDSTQIRVVTFGNKYPAVDRLMDRQRPEKVAFKKQELLDAINRVTLAAGSDRLPSLKMYLRNGEMTLMVTGTDTAMQDVIEVPGFANHGLVELLFTPKNLTEALTNAPNDLVTMHYDPDATGKILYIDGGSGYEVWIVPRAMDKTE